MPTNTLTLRDIADLAGVQRPVVSMWRKRVSVRGQQAQFPRPVATEGGIEHFSRADVEAYLAETGRGKNADVTLDSAAYVVPASSLEDVMTLLCLRVHHGDDLEGNDLSAVAHSLDPRDEFCRREVMAMSNPPVAYVDELFASSYGAADAVARLVGSRLGRGAARFDLEPAAVSLVSEMVRSLLASAGPDTAQLVDGSEGASGLAIQVAEALGASLVLDADGADSRAIRRRATMLELSLAEPTDGPAIRVDSVVGLDVETALDRLDNLQLELGPGDIGLAVGPAAVLCDRFRDKTCELARDGIIRKGRRLRLAVRLPRGLWPAAPRQALGLWVLADHRQGQERIAVADLSDVAISDIDVTDLALDGVAATQTDLRHSHRYVLSREAALVLAADHVVTRGTRAIERPYDVRDRSNEVERLSLIATGALANMAFPEPAAGGRRRRTATIAELRGRQTLRVVSGTRLDAAWAEEGGTVVVADVTGQWAGVAFDPFELESRTPQARRTEPGDVVFVHNPPHAIVDEHGGRVVASPARVLRLAEGAPIGPRSLAAQINRLPQSARDADAWRVSLTDDEGLEPALVALDDLRRDLVTRLAAIDDLTQHLVDGVAAGELTLTTEKD